MPRTRRAGNKYCWVVENIIYPQVSLLIAVHCSLNIKESPLIYALLEGLFRTYRFLLMIGGMSLAFGLSPCDLEDTGVHQTTAISPGTPPQGSPLLLAWSCSSLPDVTLSRVEGHLLSLWGQERPLRPEHIACPRVSAAQVKPQQVMYRPVIVELSWQNNLIPAFTVIQTKDLKNMVWESLSSVFW